MGLRCKKGDLITMDLGTTAQAGTNNLYRVLKTDGDKAEVVAMYDASTSVMFNANNINTYDGYDLDTYLNTTFYNTLNDTAKAAIVERDDLVQYEYTYNSSTYDATTHASYADYSTKSAKATLSSKNIYALDVEDIEEYFSNTFSTSDIWTLFWNTTSAPSTLSAPWLRSARADDSEDAFNVDGYYGNVSYLEAFIDGNAARPAFTIDLSKISAKNEANQECYYKEVDGSTINVGQNMTLLTKDKVILDNLTIKNALEDITYHQF